jgi:hypothetical protein
LLQRGQTGWIGAQKCEVILKRALITAQSISIKSGTFSLTAFFSRRVDNWSTGQGKNKSVTFSKTQRNNWITP